jgi:HAD superfamily hydrolase (TIGR01549 family)
MQRTVIIWDFDGTLADSNRKNFEITRQIMERELGLDIGGIAALQDFPVYLDAMRKFDNWRSLYAQGFGVPEDEIDRAGDLWAHYQMNTDVAAPLFPGMPAVLKKLSKHPMGIVSQNSAGNIRQSLKREGCEVYFKSIVGYQDVPYTAQKPDPAGLLLCIEKLLEGSLDSPGRVVFVGDHATDTETAANAHAHFASSGQPVTVHSLRVAFDVPYETNGAQCNDPQDLCAVIGGMLEHEDAEPPVNATRFQN